MRKLWVLGFSAVAALAGTPAFAISTMESWDGSEYVFEFGCPQSSTYGQVVTVPKNKSTLNRFAFMWADAGSKHPMVVRGEVYRWDGEKATGDALYESDPRTIFYSDGAFHTETFPAMVSLTPGVQYVIFASIDKDYEQCKKSVLKWGAVDDSSYKNGTFAYQNGDGDESRWTTAPWTGIGGIDLAFKALFGP